MTPYNVIGPNRQENYFRRKIRFDHRPGRVICRIYSDTGYELFINGRLACKTSEWCNLRDYDLTPFFQTGENLIAVRAMNASGHRGFAFELAADGRSHLVSDRSWKVFPEERWGWLLPAYDDSSWGNAVEMDMSAAGSPQWLTPPGSDPGKVIPWLENTPFFTGEVPKCVDSPFFTAALPPEKVSDTTCDAAGDAYRDYVNTVDPEVVPARKFLFADPAGGTLSGDLTKVTVTAPERYTGPSFVIDLGGNQVGFFRMRSKSGGPASFRLYHAETAAEALGECSRDLVQNRMLREEYRIEGGTQEFEERMRFGGRYLRVEFFDTPQPVELSGFSLRTSLYPVRRRGYFHCSDPLLNRLWTMGEKTLHLCMQEYYLDAPKRDRLLWVGDTRFEALYNYYTFADTALFEFCWEKFSLVQYPDGGIPAVYGPGSSVLWDYVAWYVIAFKDHYWHTGETAFLLKHRKNVEKAVDFLVSKAGADGLIDVPPNPLRDRWNVVLNAATGKDVLLNTLYLQSLETAVLLEQFAGDAATERKYAQLLERTARSLKTLPEIAATPRNWSSSAMLYMIVRERAAKSIPEALGLFRKEWSKLAGNNSDTLAEGFYEDFYQSIEDPNQKRGLSGNGSYCHGWTAAVLHFLPACIAGITPLEPGWKRVLVKPSPCDLTEFTCVVPVPQGEIVLVFKNGKYTLSLPADCEAETVFPEKNQK